MLSRCRIKLDHMVQTSHVLENLDEETQAQRESDLARVMGQVNGRGRTRTQVSQLPWLRAFTVASQLCETRA